jgi:hypothetical protein
MSMAKTKIKMGKTGYDTSQRGKVKTWEETG